MSEIMLSAMCIVILSLAHHLGATFLRLLIDDATCNIVHSGRLFVLPRCLLQPRCWALSRQMYTDIQAAIMAAEIEIPTEQMNRVKPSFVWSDTMSLRQLNIDA